MAARGLWEELPVGAEEESEGFSLPMGTVTFLLTDVEGSSRLWEIARDGMARAIPRHYEILAEAIARWRGVRPLEQGEGDSVVAAFARASDAVAAAVDAQLALAAEEWPEAAPLRVRIALHTGEAELRDGCNYFGQAIVRCARLREIVHGAQVAMSASTFDLVRDRLPAGVTVADLGLHRLRDLSRPEHVFGVLHAELPAEFPPLRSLDALPNNLPVQLTTFIGRVAEIGEVRDLLGVCRLLTLTGSGGCGKTRLALQVAAEGAGREPDGAWWVDLARLADPDAVVDAVLGSLSLSEEPGRPPGETLLRQLATKQLLLVLDNCEHVIDTTSALIELILCSCPAVTVLATSREPLRLPGEMTWQVPSLSLPAGDGPEPVASLSQYDAVRLFIDRARRARPSFHLDDDNGPAVAQICHRLGGIPLAVELAASWVRTLSPDRIARGLDDRFRLLTGGSRTAIPRQQTLRASVEWSHDALSEAERTVFRRLAVFSGGFDLDAAEAVGAGDGVEHHEVLDLLTRLVDKSLVQSEERGGDLRYRLLETLRHYALERLADAGEDRALRSRHLDHFLALAEQWEQGAQDAHPEALDRLELEADNLRAALDTATTARDAERALRLARALTFFWVQHGHLRDGHKWFERALEIDTAAATGLRSAALWGWAYLAFYGWDHAKATGLATEALELARAAGGPGAAARPLHTLGLIQVLHDPEGAHAGLREAIELAREAGDEWCATDALQGLAFAHVFQEDHAGARPLLEESYKGALRRGNLMQEAAHFGSLGWAANARGEFVSAEALLDRAQRSAAAIGDPNWRGFAIGFLAGRARCTGDYDGSRRLIGEHLEAARESGLTLIAAHLLWMLGLLELAVGDLDAARSAQEEALAWLGGEEILPASWVGMALADVLARLGDVDACRTHLRESAALAERMKQRSVMAGGRQVAARLAVADGDPERAEQLLHEALALAMTNRFRPQAVELLEELARVAGSLEAHREAVRLLSAADRARKEMGFVRPPISERDDAPVLAAAREALDSTFDAAWEEGAALTLEEAVAYASRARGERKRPATGWASLTPTEVEVVRLVAEGLTNPDIGARAFMSLSTVKTHLTHVFGKLGVTTRAELATLATRRGI